MADGQQSNDSCVLNAERVRKGLTSKYIVSHIYSEHGPGGGAPLSDPEYLQGLHKLLDAKDVVALQAPTAAGKSRYVTGGIAKSNQAKPVQSMMTRGHQGSHPARGDCNISLR